jgi:hypothetical protein
MTTARTGEPDTTAARGAAGPRTLLVVLAVGQLVSSILSQRYGGEFQTEDRPGEPPIVPAGYTFSIWLVIIALALGYAVWAQPRHRPGLAVRDRLTAALVLVFAGFSLWLVAAELEPRWATLVILLGMVAALLWALQIALAARAEIAGWPRVGRALLWGLLGLYTGWTSIAAWINLTTALAASGAPITGIAGVVGQLAVLAGATATAVAILAWTGGLLPYAAAVAWAFVGVAHGADRAGQPLLAGGALVGLVAVLATLAVLRPRGGAPLGPRRS